MQGDTDDSRTVVPTLEAMKVGIIKADQQFFIDIDQHIREKHITGVMATSLMNDNSYTNNIANNLLEIGSILFKSRDSGMHELEQSLMLDEQETIDAVATRKRVEEKKKRSKGSEDS